MTASRLVMLHGFTQTGAVWNPIIARLRELGAPWSEYRTPDAPGHGEAASSRLDLIANATTLARRFGPATYLGYSMGGRQALHLAVTEPEAVQGLILISSTAGLRDEAARAERRRADAELALRIEQIGIEAFLDEWLARPMFAGLDSSSALLDIRRANTAQGLASSLRLAGTGTQEPLWDRLHTVRAPTLVIAGALDTAYAAIAAELCRHLPHAELVIIEGAGHAVPFECPEPTVAAILDWSRRYDGADHDPGAVQHLHPSGGAEDRNQGPVAGTGENGTQRP